MSGVDLRKISANEDSLYKQTQMTVYKMSYSTGYRNQKGYSYLPYEYYFSPGLDVVCSIFNITHLQNYTSAKGEPFKKRTVA